MPVTSDRPAPYGPAKVVIELIERHRNKGLPIPVDADVLARAGVSESLIPRTLQTLAGLDLIDSEGRVTPALEAMRLAPEAEYRPRMVEWLNNVYADALSFVDPSTDSESDVRDAFRKYTPTGQQDRMVTLFMGLFRHAGVAPDKTPTGGAAQRKKPLGPATPKPRAEKLKTPPLDKPDGGGAGAGTLQDQNRKQPQSDYMSALLAKFPDFDPAWPDDIKAKWFEGFETFMKGVAQK